MDLIVCMDLPPDPETYLHRIGRAGRYGALGTAVSFVCEKDELAQFEALIDSYNLRVTQFDDNLNDLVSLRNFELANDNRVDDFTIEKVNLTKEELDRSLFEYENTKKMRDKAIGRNKFERRTLKNDRSELLKSLQELDELNVIRFKDVSEIRKDLEKFKLSQKKKWTENETNSIQNVYKLIAESRMSFKMEVSSISEMLTSRDTGEKEINKDLESSSIEETMKPLNWEPVKNTVDSSDLDYSDSTTPTIEPSSTDDDQIQLESDEQMDAADSVVEPSADESDEHDEEDYDLPLYTYYHNYYFNYFLNELLNSV